MAAESANQTGALRLSTAEARRQASLTYALGPVIAGYLSNPAVTDIMLNADGTLWCEEHGKGRRKIGELPTNHAESVIRLLATHMGAEATREHPTVSGVLPGTDARFQGVLPPIVEHPVFSIRKPSEVIYTLEDFVRDEILSLAGADALRDAIERRVNLLIAGGTGSGKTTLANACLAEPAFCGDRVVIIEDTRELQCSAEDRVELLASPLLATVSMDELLRTTLRLFPGRIVVGEVRGSEALTMIKAWGTGHPGGLCTIHANGAGEALYQLEEYIGEVALSPPRRSIVRAVGLIVFIERSKSHSAGRRVTGMTRPSLAKSGDYEFHEIQM